jgi:hypothetical protein
MKTKAKKIHLGMYEYKGFYISVYEGTSGRVWNIFNDRYLIEEHAIGFRTKKEAIQFLDEKP